MMVLDDNLAIYIQISPTPANLLPIAPHPLPSFIYSPSNFLSFPLLTLFLNQ